MFEPKDPLELSSLPEILYRCKQDGLIDVNSPHKLSEICDRITHSKWYQLTREMGPI